MRKWNLKKRIALILAVMMLIMNCVPAYAEEIGGDLAVSEDSSISSDVSNTNEDNVEEENGDPLSENESVSDDVAELDSENPEDEEEIPLESSSVSDDNGADSGDEDTKVQEDSEADDESRSLTNSGEEQGASQSEIVGSVKIRSTLFKSSVYTPPLLGATGSETPEELNEWHEDDMAGIKWKITTSTNTLHISENEAADEQDRGKITGLYWVPGQDGEAGEGTGAWLNYSDLFDHVMWYGKIVEIGNYAFAGCDKLYNFVIPKDVKKIGYGAFAGCTKLGGITVSNNSKYISDTSSKGDGILYERNGDDTVTLLYCPGATARTVTISNNTSFIGQYAFYGCKKIPGEIKIPASVEVIDYGAFLACSSITKVNIGYRNPVENNTSTEYPGNSLTTIGGQAFKSCTKLTHIYIPDTVGNIDSENKPFEGTNLKYVIFYSTKKANDSTLATKYNNLISPATSDIQGHEDVLLPFNHCILFYDKGSSIVKQIWTPQTVNCGEYADKDIMPTPSYSGEDGSEDASQYFRFGGWWATKDGKAPRYDDDSVGVAEKIIGDTTVYAKWIEYIYLSFDLNGGTIDGDKKTKSVSCDLGTNFTEWPTKTPSLNGVKDTFVGWYDPISKYTFVEDVETVDKYYASKPRAMTDSNKSIFKTSRTLRAVYYKFVTIKFNSMLGETVSEISLPAGTKLPADEINRLKDDPLIKDNYPEEEGWKWKGWYTQRGVELDLNIPVALTDNNTTYIAQFDRFATINYYNEDNKKGDYPTDVVSIQLNDSETTTYTIKKKPVSVNGYRCVGWYSEPDGQGSKWYGEIEISDKKLVYDFYAYFLKEYNITTNDQKTKIGGEKDTENTYTVVSGANIYDYGIPPQDDIHTELSQKHYAFDGWYTEPEGGERVGIDYPFEKDMTVYAHWKEGYLIGFYYEEEGKLSAFQEPYVAQWGSGMIVPEMTREWADANGFMGYDFLGWYENGDEGGIVAENGIKIYKDYSFVARWEDDPSKPKHPQVTVSFNSMGGSSVPEQTVSENTQITKPADPTWTDHKFQGWFTDTDYSRQWDFENDVVTENMYLYAKWISWTEEDEDRLHGIYWVRLIKNGKASLAEYFRESGLKYSYDRNIVKFRSGKKVVKGKKLGETRITATKGDGSDYPISVRVFVLKQELQDMYGYSNGAKIDANEFLTVSGFPPDRWVSTKPSVASIDAKTGIITVRKRGRAKIKAYYQNKAVTATFKSEVPKFAKPFYRLKTGQTKKLKIKRLKKYDIVSWNVLPEGSLSVNNPSWNDIERAASEAYSTSYNAVSGNRSASMNVVSNNEIMGIGSAEIDGNGKITALTAGDVIVYAAVYGQIISTKVHIEPPILRKKSMVLKINKTTKLKLSRTKLKNVEWKTSNDKVAYVDPVSGKVYGLKSGRVTLRTNAGGVVNTCSVQVQDTAVNVTKGPALSR